eukprot:2801225-Rhodomonas_salina.1
MACFSSFRCSTFGTDLGAVGKQKQYLMHSRTQSGADKAVHCHSCRLRNSVISRRIAVDDHSDRETKAFQVAVPASNQLVEERAHEVDGILDLGMAAL